MIPDWQLPPGVDRGVWDYVRNARLAQNYDASLAGTPLLQLDLRYCEEHFTTPGRLVDLGCGTGRLALHFAARGFACTAVDLSAAMLDELKRKAEALQLPIEIVEANLAELDLPADSFDCAACLFSTYGMLRGRNHRAAFLKSVYRLLKPGGRFAIHAHNRGHHRFRAVGWPWAVRDLVRQLRGREPGEYPMPQHAGGSALTLRHFTAAELRADLTAAGFRTADFRPISLRPDGRFRLRWGKLSRAYGFLALAIKP